MTLRRSLVPCCVCASLLLLLQGCCLTNALWSCDEPGEERVLVAETTTRHVVAASLDADSALHLETASPAGGAPSAWRLTGAAESQVALTFLTTGGPLLIDELLIDAGVEWERGEPSRSAADVRIVGKIDASRLGQAITWNELPPATRDLLQQESGPRFAFTAEEPAAVSSVFHRCGERLRELDLRPLVLPAAARREAPVCAACVLVGADLRPFPPGPAAGANGNGPEPSFSEQLRTLEPARFVVLLTDGSVQSLFVVRADRVPLWSSLAATGDGRYEHRSLWAFGGASADAGRAPRWRGTLHVAERKFEWQAKGMSVWAQLALTPLAVAGDVCGAWVLDRLGLAWWCGDEEDEDDEPAPHVP